MIIPLQFDLMAILQDLLRGFVVVVPNLLGALAVFFIGLIVSKVAARFIQRILVTIGADKLAERLNEIEIVYKSNIQLVPSKLLSKVVYYFLLFIFVIAATDILNMPVISQLMGEILNYIPVLISALAVFVIGLLISDFLKNVVKTTCDSLGLPAAGMISSVIFYFLFLIQELIPNP